MDDLKEAQKRTPFTSHARAMLGSCQLIAGQLERGEKLRREDIYTLAKVELYLEAFRHSHVPEPADIHDVAARRTERWAGTPVKIDETA